MTHATSLEIPAANYGTEALALLARIREVCAASPLDLPDQRNVCVAAGLGVFLDEASGPQAAALAAEIWLKNYATDLVVLMMLLQSRAGR